MAFIHVLDDPMKLASVLTLGKLDVELDPVLIAGVLHGILRQLPHSGRIACYAAKQELCIWEEPAAASFLALLFKGS